MFKLIVDGKNGHEESEFETEEAAKAHFNKYKKEGYFGKDAQVIHHEEIPGVKEIIENGVVIQEAVDAIPAWTELIPGEYTWSIIPVNPALADLSPRQIALALLSIGITEEQVIAAINKLPSPQREQGIIAWDRSNYFVRTEPAVAMIGALADLSSEQLDEIWKLGVTL